MHTLSGVRRVRPKATGAAAKVTGGLTHAMPRFKQACPATAPIQTLSARHGTCQEPQPTAGQNQIQKALPEWITVGC
jgi:hypothetical protein